MQQIPIKAWRSFTSPSRFHLSKYPQTTALTLPRTNNIRSYPTFSYFVPTLVGFTSIKPLTFLAVLLTQTRACLPVGRKKEKKKKEKKLTCGVKNAGGKLSRITRTPRRTPSLAPVSARLSCQAPLRPGISFPSVPRCVRDSQLHAPSRSRAASSRPAEVLTSKVPTADCSHCSSVNESIQLSTLFLFWL